MSKPKPTHYWKYLDANQQMLMIMARYDKEEGKYFRPFIKQNNEWKEKAPPKPYPLFGLHALPVSTDDQIIICEGEKCVQALLSLGISAVTSPFGSSSAKQCDWSVLKSYRRFLLLPDDDQAGEKYVRQVCDLVKEHNPEAIMDVCHLPVSQKGGDVVDWIQQQLREQAVEWDGFSPIDPVWIDPIRECLEQAFIEYQQPANQVWPVVSDSSLPLFEEDPQPLNEELLAVKPVPIDYLPDAVKTWALHNAESMQVPVDFLIVPLLLSIGSLIGRKRAVSPSPYDKKWIEVPNNYGMIIGKPSVMKSPALSRALFFLDKIDEEEQLLYEQQHKEYQVQMTVYKEVSSESCNQIRKESSKHSPKAEIDYEEYEQYIQEPPKQPRCKRYKTDDPTTQKLAHILTENPNGLLIHRDELCGFLRGLEKKGNEGDRAFYLEGWNGKNRYTVDRIGRGTLRLPALCLSILGGVQPGPLKRYINEAVGKGEGSDSFLQRFQLAVWPDFLSEWEPIKIEYREDLDQQIETICHRINQLEFDSTKSSPSPVILRFSDKAQLFFDCWRSHFERHIRDETLPDYLVSHLTKYRKTMPTLALIFSLMQAENPQSVVEIDPEHVTAAINWCEYLESHAKRIYHSGLESNGHISARELLKRIKNKELTNGFTHRLIYHRKQWSHLRTREQAFTAIDVLETFGWIRGQTETSGGRPTKKYYIHPNAVNMHDLIS